MWFDIPIFAFKESAIPETLGKAALTFSEKNDLPELALCAHVLISDAALREKVLQAQRRRRVDFLPEKVAPVLTDMVNRLGARAGAARFIR
jgi:hypothetical protein